MLTSGGATITCTNACARLKLKANKQTSSRGVGRDNGRVSAHPDFVRIQLRTLDLSYATVDLYGNSEARTEVARQVCFARQRSSERHYVLYTAAFCVDCPSEHRFSAVELMGDYVVKRYGFDTCV